MPCTIPLRSDFDAPELRRLARRSKDAAQAHRLLALAANYDGGTRGEATQLGVLVTRSHRGPVEPDLTRRRGPAWKAAMEAGLPAGRLGRPEEIAATALLLTGPGGDLLRGGDAVAERGGCDVLRGFGQILVAMSGRAMRRVQAMRKSSRRQSS